MISNVNQSYLYARHHDPNCIQLISHDTIAWFGLCLYNNDNPYMYGESVTEFLDMDHIALFNRLQSSSGGPHLLHTLVYTIT